MTDEVRDALRIERLHIISMVAPAALPEDATEYQRGFWAAYAQFAAWLTKRGAADIPPGEPQMPEGA